MHRFVSGITVLMLLAGGQAAADSQARQHYGKLPLVFEANQGQTDARAKFLARGQGYGLFLTPNEAVLSLDGAAVRMRLEDANPQPLVRGLDKQASYSNYLIGDDPDQWRSNIAHYGKVLYEQMYEGIDLVFYGAGRKLEYDFIVAPGADPNVIRMDFAGAESMRLNDAGELVLATVSGEIVQHRPVVYQQANGQRQPVHGEYVLLAENQVGFALGAYDASRELVIDPVLDYSTYLGGTGSDFGEGIAVDSSGAAYVEIGRASCRERV